MSKEDIISGQIHSPERVRENAEQLEFYNWLITGAISEDDEPVIIAWKAGKARATNVKLRDSPTAGCPSRTQG